MVGVPESEINEIIDPEIVLNYKSLFTFFIKLVV